MESGSLIFPSYMGFKHRKETHSVSQRVNSGEAAGGAPFLCTPTPPPHLSSSFCNFAVRSQGWKLACSTGKKG